MKMLTRILGVLMLVFSFAYYNASPLQKRRGHRHGHGPKKHHYHRPHRPYYREVVYHRPPRHHYRKRHYRPTKHRHHSHRTYRVHHSRPVIIVGHR